MKNNICFDDLVFGGRNFHTRDIYVPGWGQKTVSNEALENVLLKDGAYVSEDAREVDESIFFFAENDKFNSLSDKELGKYIAKACA